MASPFSAAYSPAFDPGNHGTITGFLGTLMGRPTQAQDQGGAIGKAEQALSASIQAGKPRVVAAHDFINSPDGQEFFAHAGEDPGGILTKILDQLAPAPTLAGPGQGMLDTQTGQPVGPGIPTAEGQLYNQIIPDILANVPPDKQVDAKAALAVLVLNGRLGASGQNISDKAKAVLDLVASGAFTERVGQQIMAGTRQVTTNADGNAVDIVDIGTGERTPLIQPSGSGPGQFAPSGDGRTADPRMNMPSQAEGGMLRQPGAAMPPQAPQSPAQEALGVSATQTPPDQNNSMAAPPSPGNVPPKPPANPDDPNDGSFGIDPQNAPNVDMVNAAGIAQTAESVGGGLLGNFFPEMSGQDATKRQQGINIIKNDMTKLLNNGRLKSITDKMDNLIKTNSVSSNPIQLAQQLLDLRNVMSSEARKQQRIIGDQSATKDMQDQAKIDFMDLKLAVGDIPAREELEKALSDKQAPGALGPVPEFIQKMKQGAAGFQSDVKSFVQGVEGAPPQAPQSPAHTPQFKTEAEAKAAFDAGTLGPDQQFYIGNTLYSNVPKAP